MKRGGLQTLRVILGISRHMKSSNFLCKWPQQGQSNDKSVGLLAPVVAHYCANSCPQDMNTPTCLTCYLRSCDYSVLLNLAGNHYLLATFHFSEIVSYLKISPAVPWLTKLSLDIINFPFSSKVCRVTSSVFCKYNLWSRTLTQCIHSGRCLCFH